MEKETIVAIEGGKLKVERPAVDLDLILHPLLRWFAGKTKVSRRWERRQVNFHGSEVRDIVESGTRIVTIGFSSVARRRNLRKEELP